MKQIDRCRICAKAIRMEAERFWVHCEAGTEAVEYMGIVTYGDGTWDRANTVHRAKPTLTDADMGDEFYYMRER